MPKLLTSQVFVPNGDLLIEAYRAMPAATDRPDPAVPDPAVLYPAVIVIQEVFGVNEYIRAIGDRIASWGYVAIAPAMFQRTAPGFAVGYSPEELALGRSHKDQMTAAQIVSDITATIGYLRQLPAVQTAAIGIVGFCFGGHVAFLGATLPDIQAAALFYPSGVAVMTPGGGAPSLTRADQIQGTVYGFFGTADPLIPHEQLDQIEAAFQQQGVSHQIWRYPVGHGFACDRRAEYDAAAAIDAWGKVQSLFEQELTMAKSVNPTKTG
jgi:carboxymethylenebutenolidase